MVWWQLFVGFFRVGLFGFGGGPSMLPLMQAECVGSGFVSEELFLEGLAVGNALPGPISTKMAWFVGWHHGGLAGAVSSLLGLLAPSLFLMAVLAGWVMQHRDEPWVASVLRALRPVVVGMLAFVAWDLAPPAVDGWATGILAVAAFFALVLRVHPAIVLSCAAGIGLCLFRTP